VWNRQRADIDCDVRHGFLVHGDMHLGTFAALVTVVTSAASALRRGLHRAPIENDRRGLLGPARAPAQQGAQVMREGFKEAGGLDPALGLLIRRFITFAAIPGEV